MADTVLSDQEAEVIETALNAPAPNEAEVLKALGVEGDDANRATAAVRMIRSLGDKAGALLKTLAGANGDATAKPEPEPVAKDKPPPKEPEVTKTDETPLAPEVLEIAKATKSPEEYQAVVKAAREGAAVVQIMTELLKARDGEIADLRQWREQEVEKADDAAVASIVDATPVLGLSRDDQAKLVKSLSPEQREAWAGMAKAQQAAAGLQSPFREIGTARRSEPVEDPVRQVEEMAKAEVSKAGDKRAWQEVALDILNRPENAQLARAYYTATTKGG